MWSLVVALCLVAVASAQHYAHSQYYPDRPPYPQAEWHGVANPHPVYAGFGAGFPYSYHGFPFNYQYPQAAPAPAPAVPHPQPHEPKPWNSAQLTYKGNFDGTCDGKEDGLYYVDDRSFAFCSGGIKTIQACADGSINPAHGDFSSGIYQHYYDFCSINIAARDYARTY